VEITRDDIVKEFELETEELLDGMEQSLVALDAQPDNAEVLHSLFRGAHTLKGSAACLGFNAMADYGHELEDVLEALHTKELRATSDLVSLLLRAIDLWRLLVPAAISGADALPPEHVAMLKELADAATPGDGKAKGKKGAKAGAKTAAAEATEAAAPPSGDNAALPDRAPSVAQAAAQHARTLRVQVEHLDRIVNLTGEIAISRSRLDNLLMRPEYKQFEDLRDAHRDSERLQLELQEQVMKLRMVPIGPLFKQHVRTVRDLALSCNKQARVEMHGTDVEIDMAVLENIRDPLMHLVRNAIDHGLESPAARRQAGKDPSGLVTLRARYQSGVVEIEITDDGAGLDRASIAARAEERRLVPSAAALTDSQIFELIFLPGFSTAKIVTEISGRGMGLDVVKRNLDALRGAVEVTSKPGVGTTITLRVPLTLAIIQGFSVGVGDETYIVPLESVVECTELPAGERATTDGAGIINLRGRALPFLRLRQLFHLDTAPVARESIVVIRHELGEAGLAVDHLFGEGQVVLKPLPRGLQRIGGIFGSALLGDGRVALILDVAGLMRRVHAAGVDGEAPAKGDPTSETTIATTATPAAATPA